MAVADEDRAAKRKESIKRARAKYNLSEKGQRRAREYAKKYRAENRDVLLPKMRQYAKTYRIKQPEKAKKTQAKMRSNPEYRERARLASKAWRRANPDRIRDLSEKYYKRTKEAQVRKAIEWQRQNKEKFRVNQHNRRARVKNAPGKLSPGIIDRLMIGQGGKCVYCKTCLASGKRHLDHRMPLALGGSNSDDNVQLLCASCNCSKRHSHPDDFARKVALKND